MPSYSLSGSTPFNEKSYIPENLQPFWRSRASRSRIPGYTLKKRRRRSSAPILLLLLWLALACALLCLYSVFLSRSLPHAAESGVYYHLRHDRRLPKVHKARHVRNRTTLPMLPRNEPPDIHAPHEVVTAAQLSIVFPVDTNSLVHLPSILAPFFLLESRPGEIIVACPISIYGQVRATVANLLSTLREDGLEVEISPWTKELGPEGGFLHAAAWASEDWILVLDEKGLQESSAKTIDSLLAAKGLPLPHGPRGVVFSPDNMSCLKPQGMTEISAAFLFPPFVIPSNLLRQVESGIRMNSDLSIWAAVGERVAGLLGTRYGGVVVGAHEEGLPNDHDWCEIARRKLFFAARGSADAHATVAQVYRAFEWPDRGVPLMSLHFIILMPSKTHLLVFASTLCRLSTRGHAFRILMLEFRETSDHLRTEHMTLGECHFHFDVLGLRHGTTMPEWILQLQLWSSNLSDLEDILLYGKPEDSTSILQTVLDNHLMLVNSTVIGLPLASLSESDWMGELTAREWLNWHVPKIELSVITKDRPSSFQRLLSSLEASYYFGDRPRLTINLEQTADKRTQAIAEGLTWSTGEVVLRHRVVLGGLLPAIVESWYPATNDTYGVLLEDDVEVSPMFYAWLKFAILRYRYGLLRDESRQLFGVSLYQQKHVELRPEGRRPFHARALFSAFGMRYPNTPYLSQVPCSWGAVYFPEHWREFHSYLNLRLSDAGQKLPLELVPNSRSNRWARSWKKYFIELAYLRGYTMLYPNYDDFVSLSTNHLEPGSHVHEVPEPILMKKKSQFQVPLMGIRGVEGGPGAVRLLDLPQGTLPLWEDLPVVDLWANLSSHQELLIRGITRREGITRCSRLVDVDVASSFHAGDLLCFQDDDDNDRDEFMDETVEGVIEELEDDDETYSYEAGAY